jgi:hypothetical protein
LIAVQAEINRQIKDKVTESGVLLAATESNTNQINRDVEKGVNEQKKVRAVSANASAVINSVRLTL